MLEPVYCLGLCATAPAMSINDKPYARVGATKFDHLLAQLKEAALNAARPPEGVRTAVRSTEVSK